MIDNGKNDEKILAIPFSDPDYNHCRNMEDLPRHIFDEIQHFFSVYKQLEGKQTAVDTLAGQDEAMRVIQDAIDNYKANFIR